MQLKQMVRYRMNFGSGWLTASAFFAGLGIFSTALYYFFLNDASVLSAGDLILHVILPLFWFAAYAVLLKGIQLNIPLVYGAMSAAYCLLMIIWGFSTPTVLGPVLGTAFYLLAAVAFLATALGLIPGKFYLAAVLAAVVLMQVFWKDLPVYLAPMELQAYLPHLAKTSGVAALSLLCMGMQGFPVKKANK